MYELKYVTGTGPEINFTTWWKNLSIYVRTLPGCQQDNDEYFRNIIKQQRIIISNSNGEWETGKIIFETEEDATAFVLKWG